MKKINGKNILLKIGLSTQRAKLYGKLLEEVLEDEMKNKKESKIKTKDILEVDECKDIKDKEGE